MYGRIGTGLYDGSQLLVGQLLVPEGPNAQEGELAPSQNRKYSRRGTEGLTVWWL